MSDAPARSDFSELVETPTRSLTTQVGGRRGVDVVDVARRDVTTPGFPSYPEAEAAQIPEEAALPTTLTLNVTGLGTTYDVKAPFMFSGGVTYYEKVVTSAHLKNGGAVTSGYNAVAIPEAAGTLFPQPIELDGTWYCAPPVSVSSATVAVAYEVLGGGSSDHPFKVSIRNNGTEESPDMQVKVGVGFLFQSLRPGDKYAISDLDTWMSTDTLDKIWLGVTFTTAGVPDWAGIDSWETSGDFDITKDAWSGLNGYCEDDGGTPPAHQTSRKLIAYITGTGTNLEVNQVMFHDQILRNVCIDGKPARYPFDHGGGYPL